MHMVRLIWVEWDINQEKYNNAKALFPEGNRAFTLCGKLLMCF